MKRSIYNLKTRRVCFRRWGNRSFSVFNSLKVLVKISVVSATYSLIATPETIFAQESDSLTTTKNAKIEEVVITSPQAASTYSELSRAMVVITNEEFSHLPVTTLQELLENIASVDIRQRGGHGVQADLMIRGGTFDQVLVLLNGINITDPQTGHHNLNIPIDLQSIERIEILQGPGTRIYGPGTYSGAINIITKFSGESFTQLSAIAGQNGLIKGSASKKICINKANVFIAASTSKSDGYIENTDFKIYNLFTHTNIEQKKGTFDFQLGYQDKAFGAQSFYTPRFPEQFEQTGTFFSSASYSKKISSNSISSSVYARSHRDRFELFRYDSPDWYKGHNYHITWVYGSKLQFSSINKMGRSRAGSEIRHETIHSNVLGELLALPKPIRGFSDTSYTHGASRNLVNLFADHTIYLNTITISGGGLFSYNNQFGMSWSYGIDFSYRVLRELSIFFSINNAIRHPTFTDLYYSGPTNQGNENLKPERANNFEVGIKLEKKQITASSTLFYRNGKDVIDWVKPPNDELWKTMNHTEINTTGIENWVMVNTSEIFAIVNSISVGYQYMHSDKNSSDLLSYYALDYLKHKATFSVNHQIYSKLSASWTFNWQERAGKYLSYPSEEEKKYEPFGIINLRAIWKSEIFSTFLDIHNLENREYFDLGNVPQPKRWISMGVNFYFE